MNHFKNIAFLSVIAGALITLSSCQHDPNDPGTEYAPNMYHAISYEPFRQEADFKNPYNKFGNNLWLPVKGTIARRNYQTRFGADSSAVEDLMIYNIPKTASELRSVH
jgi:hypothetical protein